MNRQSVNHSQVATLSLRHLVSVGIALVLTLASGLFYYSWQTARLADQVLKGKPTAQLPAARPGPQDYVTTINRGRFKALGLAIPPAFDACDCFIN